ncbi:MAG: LysR family transcriptional regulator [Gammaproteobacteria bacterium]|nr:LysR family transcriptional regulator [Gammaproteobacteria bacterium]
MDKISEMTMFARTVSEGSFSAAARALKLTPSAVSKQVSRLEDRLGARLLNRTTRRLSLTEEGRAFHARCEQILAEIEEAETAVTELHAAPRGTLRIAAAVAFFNHQVMPLLPEFLARYPEVRFDLVMTDREVDMVDERIDVAIRFGQMRESTLIARRLAVSRRVICAAPSYLERHGTPRTPADLVDHNCLTLSTRPEFNVWEFGDRPEDRMRVDGNLEVSQADALYDACLAGIGLARVAGYLVEADLKAGRLVTVLEGQLREESTLYVAYPHRRHLSPKVRAFVDFLVAKFTPVPPWASAPTPSPGAEA